MSDRHDGRPIRHPSDPDGVRSFLILVSTFFFVIATDAFIDAVTHPIAVAAAHTLTACLRFFGVDATIFGVFVNVARGSIKLEVADHCVAMPAYATFVALALTRRCTFARRLGLALAFVAGFSALNLLRLASLIGVDYAAPQWSWFIHQYVWNGVLFVIVTASVARGLGILGRVPRTSSLVGD